MGGCYIFWDKNPQKELGAILWIMNNWHLACGGGVIHLIHTSNCIKKLYLQSSGWQMKKTVEVNQGYESRWKQRVVPPPGADEFHSVPRSGESMQMTRGRSECRFCSCGEASVFQHWWEFSSSQDEYPPGTNGHQMITLAWGLCKPYSMNK